MILRLIIFLLISGTVYSQSENELDKRNGFKDIKMVSSVSAYEGLEFKKEIEDKIFPEARLYTAKKGFYESIGKLKIFDLQVKAYKDSVYEIRVVTEKDPNLYKGMKKLFGEPEYAYGAGSYYWRTENLQLAYSSYSKNRIEMVYRSYIMVEQRKEEKKEVVQDIADDF